MPEQGRDSHCLAVNRLSLAFVDESQLTHAVDAIDFSIAKGETVAIIGESGCGKSLTSNAIANLLPPNACYGKNSQVIFQQQDILKLSESKLRALRGKRIAMIFQEPMTALNPVMTIGQQIAEVIECHENLDSQLVRKKVVDLLNEVEMPDPQNCMDDYPHQLSGGQKQRVVIAMAIACQPDLLIADEPTTALDVTIQQQILQLINNLQKKHHMSLLLITHDLGVAKAMADRICVMYCGQIVESALTKDFFSQVKHPYSQQLLAALPDISKRSVKLHSIKGHVPSLKKLPTGCRFHPRCVHKLAVCENNQPIIRQLDNRKVSCHLYPDSSELPDLKLHLEPQNSQCCEEVILDVNNIKIHFIKQQGLLKRQKKVFKAVDGVSFQLRQGETLAVVGESGCGKTTLSRALLQLIPIVSGKIHFDNRELTNLSQNQLRAIRRDIQIVFQDPFSSMNPRMIVLDIIAEGLRAHYPAMPLQKIEDTVIDLLHKVGLDADSRYRYPHQFSGGQRQRISIARALALKPKLIICDEPTSALDVSVQAQVLNLLKSLQGEYKLAYLFITHDMSVVSYMADRILVMQAGKVIEQGSALDILKNPTEPYTKRLLSAVYTI